MLSFSGERIVPEADNCEPHFALKMYQEHIARYLFAAQRVAGKSALDVGCGVGYGAQLLARHGAAKVTAFDVSLEAIDHARRFYAHPVLKYLVASAEDFSFVSQFDVITCFELIEHLGNQYEAVQRIAASLAPDGILVISTPRPVGSRRSAFHTRELSFLDFSNLLECHFRHVEYFFENNHFSSLITDGVPKAIESVYPLHPQFALGQADYFVAIASHSVVDRSSFRAQLVLNDDGYVRNLEHDVKVLHRAEKDFKDQIQALTAQATRENELASVVNALKAELGSVQDELSRARVELEATKKDLNDSFTAAGSLQQHVSELTDANSRLVSKSEMDQRNFEEARKRLANAAAELKREQDRAKQEAAALISDLQISREQVLALQSEIATLRRLNLETEARIKSYEQRFKAVVCSRSWRLTGPLRDLALAVRGRAHDPLRMQTVHNGLPASGPNVQNEVELPLTTAEQFRVPSRPRFDVLYIVGCHDGESKRYRAHNLVDGLTQLGYCAESWPQDDIPRLVQEVFSAQIVVLFRCGYDRNVETLLWYCRENGITTIFDVDDLVFEPESIDYVRVLRTFPSERRAEYRAGVESYKKTLLACDRATCSTAFLAGRIEALGKRVDVIRNSLNDKQLEIARALTLSAAAYRSAIRIGYFSGSNTHQADFEHCEIALLTVMERHPEVQFVLVGILELGSHWDRFAGRIERHPIVPYAQMLSVLSTVDINIAPLEVGNPYCEGKSQLKIFEAGVLLVPTVASATASYREAIEHGVDGFLADTTEAWIASLEKLVQSSDLRRSIGEQAKHRAMTQFGPEVAANEALRAYNLAAPKKTFERTQDVRLKITWIIPDLIIGGGGHRNILRAAYHLEQFGHELELYFTNTSLSSDELRQQVRSHFYPLACPMYRYEGTINSTDVLFATHWSTVQAAMRAREVAGQVMYFVQDFEPAFAPMGSEYVLAENTYRLGLYHITSGPWCEAILKNNYGCEADHFLFPVDRAVYHPRPRSKTNKNIVFFAKPEMPRRCFELGIAALEQLHRLRPDIEIVLFGSRNVESVSLPFPATVRSLLPTIQDLAQLYANADLGIVFSTTNPSLVPYEMMACGLPVVDLGRPGNEINYGGRYDIALLADPDPAKMAHQIADIMNDPEQLLARSRQGIEFVHSFPSEEEMARRVEELILKRAAQGARRSAVVMS